MSSAVAPNPAPRPAKPAPALLGGSVEPTPLAPSAADETRLLYERYGDRIFAFCLSRLGKREEAEDAVQTTFLYVLRGLRRGVEPRFPLAWLFKIAENVCHSRHRADSRRNHHEASRDPDLVAALAAPARADDELMGLPEALQTLPERQRRALLLREWQGLSYREIGTELGLSQSAVETLLFRARRSLASRLRALDLGAALAFLRSLLKGGAGKIAAAAAVATVGTAGLVLPAVDPGRAEPAGPARVGGEIQAGSTPAATAVGTPEMSGGVLVPSTPRAGRSSGERPTPWSARTRAGSPAQATTPVTPGTSPASPGAAPAPAPTVPSSTPTAGRAPSVPSTNVGTGATTPVASAGATVSTDDGSATASAGVGADTPAGPVEASAGAGASTSGAGGSVDASVGSQSVGTTVTVPVSPPPAPKLP